MGSNSPRTMVYGGKSAAIFLSFQGVVHEHSRQSLRCFRPAFPLVAWEIARRDPGPHDVQIQILYCGVCHSDLHQARNEWKNTLYPCVPGHEIVGREVAVGEKVTRFKVGDFVGVGCMVDSCWHCDACASGEEQYCSEGFVGTYNGRGPGSENTYGGYSQVIVVKEAFVQHIKHPEKDLAAVAPLRCAGITTYSPLRHWNVGPGKKVGIVGQGGLGYMAVKLTHAAVWRDRSSAASARRRRC